MPAGLLIRHQHFPDREEIEIVIFPIDQRCRIGFGDGWQKSALEDWVGLDLLRRAYP